MIDLEKILELEANASPANWYTEYGEIWSNGSVVGSDIADRKFIVYARNDIRKICEELKAARGAIELLENIEEFAWDVDREKSQEILYKYHEVTNGKG